MKNPISLKLIELKEIIAKKTSQIDKCKGELSMLHGDLARMGFTDILTAKKKCKFLQINLQKKTRSLNIQIENLEITLKQNE